ncbi:MAG: hypothetical protein QQN41_10885, partial [Nitrosopumilus sp.]
VVSDIRQFIPDILSKFGKTIDKSSVFINDNLEEDTISVSTSTTKKINVYNVDGLEIEIATVHSSKGQTHTTTLYLESNYQQTSNGVAYESQRLADQFNGLSFSDSRKFHKQSTKIAYVGLSRPTHLLCFGVHKDRFESNLSNNSWEIVKVYDD